MSRRPLIVFLLIISSVVVSACSDIAAPRRDDTTGAGCRSGWTDTAGRCVVGP